MEAEALVRTTISYALGNSKRKYNIYKDDLLIKEHLQNQCYEEAHKFMLIMSLYIKKDQSLPDIMA